MTNEEWASLHIHFYNPNEWKYNVLFQKDISYGHDPYGVSLNNLEIWMEENIGLPGKDWVWDWGVLKKENVHTKNFYFRDIAKATLFKLKYG